MSIQWKIGTVLAAFATAGFLACAPEADEPELGEDPGTAQLEQTREDFKETTEERLTALREDMDELKGEVDEEEAPAVEQRIQEWEQKANDLEEKIDSAEAATMDNMESWRQFEDEVNMALNELRSSYETLSQELRAAVE